jgi:hypothetical protein
MDAFDSTIFTCCDGVKETIEDGICCIETDNSLLWHPDWWTCPVIDCSAATTTQNLEFFCDQTVCTGLS